MCLDGITTFEDSWLFIDSFFFDTDFDREIECLLAFDAREALEFLLFLDPMFDRDFDLDFDCLSEELGGIS